MMSKRPAPNGWTRREFLWRSALAGGALAVAPRLLGEVPPLSVGVVGLGDRGLPLAGWCRQLPQLALRAVCDQLPAALRTAARLPGGTAPLAATDFRQLAAERGLDVVLLALPDAAVEEVALAAVEAGKDVLVAPPVPRDLLAGGRLAATAAAHGRLVALLPHTRYMAPAPWLSAGQSPRSAALSVYLPPLADEPTPRRLLAEVVDDVDFLSTVTGAAAGRLLDVASLAGPVPGQAFEIRARLRFKAESAPVLLDLRVSVSVSANASVRRSRATFAVAGCQVHLMGERLRWTEVSAPDIELGRFALAVRQGAAHRLTLPLDAASSTARLLDEVASRVDHSNFSETPRS